MAGSIANAEEVTWNQWRGPNRNGTWPGKLPVSLEKLQVAWEKPMQPSYSGPVTEGKFVYTTETVDKSFERMTAHDLETGEQVWSAEWDGAIVVPGYAMANGSWIKSTPALSEGSIVVLGMRDEVVCVDQATGTIRWKADLATRFNARRPPFGGANSNQVVWCRFGGRLIALVNTHRSISQYEHPNANGNRQSRFYRRPARAISMLSSCQ